MCLDTDVTGQQYCSIPYRPASEPLIVGEHVTGTVVRISTGDGSIEEVFVVRRHRRRNPARPSRVPGDQVRLRREPARRSSATPTSTMAIGQA